MNNEKSITEVATRVTTVEGEMTVVKKFLETAHAAFRTQEQNHDLQEERLARIEKMAGIAANIEPMVTTQLTPA